MVDLNVRALTRMLISCTHLLAMNRLSPLKNAGTLRSGTNSKWMV